MEKIKVVRIDIDGSRVNMEDELNELRSVDAILEGYDCTNENEIIEAAKEADVIITNNATISNKVCASLPKLKAIIRYGVGFDTVDINSATQNNIIVINVPDFCREEVANHVIMLMLAQCKKLIKLNELVKAGNWDKARQAQKPMASIYGETLGIIGCGKIGQTVAAKARCFGMKIIGYDKYLPFEIAAKSNIELTGLDELLAKSDYITVHANLTKETYHLIGEKQFRLMKPNATIINTSRGPIIDELALINALQEKLIAAACLDVFEQEPVDHNNPLLRMDNVITLPHSASYSDSSFLQLRISVGQEAARIARGILPKNIINKDVEPKIKLRKEEM